MKDLLKGPMQMINWGWGVNEQGTSVVIYELKSTTKCQIDLIIEQ